jgi:hypothetical protein
VSSDEARRLNRELYRVVAQKHEAVNGEWRRKGGDRAPMQWSEWEEAFRQVVDAESRKP